MATTLNNVGPMPPPVAAAAAFLQYRNVAADDSNVLSNIAQPPLTSFHPMMNQQESVGVPLVGMAVLPLPPPPGFGQLQHDCARMPGYDRFVLPSHSAAGPAFAAAAPLAPDFYQNLGVADATTTRIQTIGESYDFFGGPSAFQTANPFATDELPSLFGMDNFSVPQQQQHRDSAFLYNQDAMGLDGSNLLDSSLLDSLLMDDNPGKATSKNPFAT